MESTTHGTRGPSVALVALVAVCSLVASCREQAREAAPSTSLPPPRLRFVSAAAGPVAAVAAEGARAGFAAAAAARPAGAGAAVPIAIDRDLRPAHRAVPLTAFGVAADGDLGTGAAVAFDAAVVPRDPASPPIGRLAVRSAAGVIETFDVPDRWTTLRVDVEGAVDGLRIERTDASEDDAVLLVANPRVTVPDAVPPTVILVTSDTHRADHVSAIDPSSPVATPAIDALARDGALFTNCLSSINNTIPSHVALLTGVHPRDTKIIDNRSRLHRTANTLAERFKGAGYQTFAAVSAFLLFEDMSGLGQGFDRMNAPLRTQRDGAETLEIAARWLEDSEGAPLFLWLHLFDAHTPYEVPEPLLGRIRRGRPDPSRPEADLGMPADRIPQWLADAGIRDPDFVRALYAGEVEYLDGALGAFLSLPRAADAVVAFTADHGEALGEREVYWDHFGLRDPTIHVPLVLRGPGARGGVVSDAPVRQMDVGRTLLDMAGLEDAPFPGADLRRALGNEFPDEPRFALGAMGTEASVESEGWLLEMFLRDAEVGSSGYVHPMGRVFLYHRPSDPDCVHDRLLDEFDRARRMRAALIDWLDRAEATGLNAMNHELPPEALAKLAQLGYTAETYEARYSWWAPEARDPDWATNPWNQAFAGEGDREAAERAVEQERAGGGR